MKLGYPDTINNKAYQGEKSPFKMVDNSKADLDKDGKVSDYEENRAEAAFGSEAPLNYSPLQAKESKKAVPKVKKKTSKLAEPAKDKMSGGFSRRDNKRRSDQEGGFSRKKKPSSSKAGTGTNKKSPVKARNSGGYSFSLGENRVKKDGNTANNSSTREITTKKTDGDTGVEKPTSNKVTKTTKIVRGKRNSPNTQKTVGQAVVGGVKKVIAKRKARRAKDPNVQAKKDGRIERRELKAEGKLFKKEQKAKVTREKNKDKLATTKKRVLKESGVASIESGKKVKEIKGKRGLTGNPTSLYGSDKKNKK
tara:strand:- start:795 stop:1718 length:924 start_codon:yes stop_codon:yes gene_type:complete